MIHALLVLFAAVALGALLGALRPPPRPKDLYVQGRKVELAPLSEFSVKITLDHRTVAALSASPFLDGLLVTPLGWSWQPVTMVTVTPTPQTLIGLPQAVRERVERVRVRCLPRVVVYQSAPTVGPIKFAGGRYRPRKQSVVDGEFCA